MKLIINFVFSIGYRCYSPEFLNIFQLRKMSSPFDYLIIDFETSLKIINNKFNDYLHDIILFNKNNQKIELFYKKNTKDVDNKFYKLLENNIGYMIQNYNDDNLLFNQNYIDNDKLNDNLYMWNAICCFQHHDLLNNDIYNSLKKRCERFNYIINKYNKTTALFYITRVVNCENIVDYMNRIIEIKKQNNIECFIIMIINSDNAEENVYYNEMEKFLFLIKKVESYDIQFSKYQSDNENNINYKNEFNIIADYFTFDLIEKNDM